MKLKDIAEQNLEILSNGNIVCLLDEQDHRCVLYQVSSKTGVALEYEVGINPFVFPEPNYTVKGVLPLKDWRKWLKGTREAALYSLEGEG